MLNKSKKIILGVSVLGIAASALMLAKSASAYRGDYTQKGPDCDPEKHEAMEQSFQSNDYQAWKELMNGKGRVSQVINEDNFARFSEAHRLAEEGKYEEADQIRGELGLRTKNSGPVKAGYKGGNKDGSGMKNQE